MLSLKELERKLGEALDKETTESLNQWLNTVGEGTFLVCPEGIPVNAVDNFSVTESFRQEGKAIVIIRTYPKDDFIAFRCMETFEATGINADYIFFAEQGEYKWIKDQKILFRPQAGNFGGRTGVEVLVEGLRRIDTAGYDKIIISDSDITVHKNPLDSEFDFGGIQDLDNPRHFSGQMMIFSKWLFDKMINFDGYEAIIQYFLDRIVLHVADDTVISWAVTSWTDNVRCFNGYWTHEKMHHLEWT